MNRLKFESKGHRYYLDGKPLTGVTTIIGILDKPALVSWSSNCAVDYIKENSDTEKKGVDDFWTYSIKEEKLEQARKAWTIKRDTAGDIGTLVHEHCEEYAKSKIKGVKYEPVYESEQVEKMVKRFIDWAEENNVKFLLSEQKLYSEKYWFAGTVDLLIEIKGKKYIADLKTSSDIYYSHYIQMAGYHIALQEMGKVKDLEGYIVLNIQKTLKKDGAVKFKEKRITNFTDFQVAFLNCLSLYRFINKEKKNFGYNKK
jgi:hypothetical protein